MALQVVPSFAGLCFETKWEVLSTSLFSSFVTQSTLAAFLSSASLSVDDIWTTERRFWHRRPKTREWSLSLKLVSTV